LFGLAVVFYKAFIKDQVIVCDELDASMHPALLKMLIQSFAASASANSQLIFTTHNTSIMSDELFRRDQIWFFDKDEHAQSELFSLADFGARPTDKYERDYLLGRYGAVPAVMTYLKEGDQ
jgi:AAA15 family ATPase/GTPase